MLQDGCIHALREVRDFTSIVVAGLIIGMHLRIPDTAADAAIRRRQRSYRHRITSEAE
jgi:hypothetical protein